MPRIRLIYIVLLTGCLLAGPGSGIDSALAGLLPELEFDASDIELGRFSLSASVGGYFFEGDQGLKNNILYGFGLGYRFSRHWSAEGRFDFLKTETRPGGLGVSAYLYRLESLYHFFRSKRLEPYAAAGIGVISLNPAGGAGDTDFLVNYGIGAKYYIGNRVALRADLRHLIPFDDLKHNFAASLGVEFFFGGQRETSGPQATTSRDSDGDGIPDSADKCPGTRKGVRVAASGCPFDSHGDRDGDGVNDASDECPGTPAGA